jgi:predicted protein tyrosine phosphatase
VVRARDAPRHQFLQVSPLDLDFVSPDLAVGAAFHRDAAARLAREHGIRRVVDVRAEDCDDARALRVHGIALLHLPTRDCCAVSQVMLREAVAFLEERPGERALVHCQYGIGRSALVALCALVTRGHAPLDALRAAKDARPVVSPSPEQLEAFAAFAAALRAARGLAWEVPSFDAMAEIAYRHLRVNGDVSSEAARASSTRSA